MEIQRLEELKQILTSEKDLSKIWDFYMDNFADHAEFTDLGHPAKNRYLDTVVRKTCQEMFGNKIKITNFLLIKIAKYKFFHGPFQVDGRIGGVIYFEDINIGLLAVSADSSNNGMVKYSRFSEMARLSEPKGFSLN
ncbi:MAG: hypothetical protein SWZ49_16465 [Cyanobacteriota bacterium]|nr:hypothetical protein [Cyanobacteriota bacterium]